MPVTVKLKGRTGNQMFQIACCVAYALKHGIDYIIPEHTMNDLVWPPYFQEMHYPHDHTDVLISLKEKSHAYEELPFQRGWAGHLIELDGYFQSHKYFNKHKKVLSKIFDLPTSKIKNTVSVHVRRGDYLNYPDKHPTFTLKYFCEAVGRIFCDKDYCFKIYSDDINWCTENITPQLLSTFGMRHTLQYVISADPLHDLKCFMRAEHFLISNSTYSWMGAYFGQTSESLVVTPDEESWFGIGNKHLDVSSLIPPAWIRIKY